MRVYTKERLKLCSRHDLEHKLEMVQTSNDLSEKEIKANVYILELALNNWVSPVTKEIHDNIVDGQTDFKDFN